MCAFTLRGRRVAYDNIAVASATGRERTAGATPSTEIYGGGDGPLSAVGQNHSNIAKGDDLTSTQLEQQGNGSAAAIIGGSTDQNTTDPTNENPGSSNTLGFVTNP